MQLMRSSLLWASQNGRIENIVRHSLAARPLVRRFMPGETIADVLPAIKSLEEGGAPSIITYLGENVSTDAQADQTASEYEKLLAALTASGADAHVSIKLTQFGWDMDRARALERVRRVAAITADARTTLAIDMESSPYVDSTIGAYEKLASEFDNITLCLQAYLHRTPADVKRLLPLRPRIRLVKGAYREPASVAIQKREEITASYRAIANDLLRETPNGAGVAFGTHDLRLLDLLTNDARSLGLSRDTYEIQMLYGIQSDARRRLSAEGEKARVLISYGKAWYPWFMRRLAEKPSNLLLMLS